MAYDERKRNVAGEKQQNKKNPAEEKWLEKKSVQYIEIRECTLNSVQFAQENSKRKYAQKQRTNYD